MVGEPAGRAQFPVTRAVRTPFGSGTLGRLDQ